jgi:hypothetical protein
LTNQHFNRKTFNFSNFKHPLTTILFITVVCSLCGADDWELIVVQARAMTLWLEKFVDVSNGIPSVRTFKRVFEALSPQQLNRMLIETAGLWRNERIGAQNLATVRKMILNVLTQLAPLTSLIRGLRQAICFASFVAKVMTLASSRILHFASLAIASKGG